MSKENEMPKKVDLKSLDISETNREKLKQLFPSVFTETKNDDGEMVESVDFEKLKAELGTFSDVFESRRERYGMDWPGKKDCMKLIQQPSLATLKPCREESVNFDETENLFIEGDNLEVLKLLQKSYYSKIKMIYIDPPYNTGNEFIYPDDYSESLDTYMAYAGLIDDEGKKFSTNSANEGRFHTKWQNMMYPRLYLARNLLSDNGILFISIDDNEVVNLKKICDEVFGEENCLAQLVWKNKYGAGALNKGFISVHEYILCYSKQPISFLSAPLSEDDMKKYNKKDSKFAERGGYITQPLERAVGMSFRENLRFPISYEGEEIWPAKQWIWNHERLKNAIENDEVVFNKMDSGKWSVRFKQYLKDDNGKIRTGKPISILNGPFNQEGTKDVENLLGRDIFPFPKPKELIRNLLSFIINEENTNDFIVLDFFAGSAPTAHAILDLNKVDYGNRKFIIVQLPERCEEKSEAFKAGYNTIADIGKERIRRVIKNIEKEQTEIAIKAKGDLLKKDEEKPKLDLGFKVLKLDKSNFNVWDGSKSDISEEKIAEQLDIHIDHIDSKASQEDILYELLLKAGFKPTEIVEKKQFDGKTVFSIADGLLLICLEDEITKELIDEVAKAEPMQFFCLDRGFKGNDQLKANAVQTFSARNQGRDNTEQIIFRTI